VRSLVIRRLRNGAVTLVTALAVLLAIYLQYAMLRDTSFLTGWVLAAALVLLASYNLRKKLPFLPLGRSATWLQIHVYVGLLTVVVFIAHAGLSFPRGGVEGTLWLLMVLLLASGLFGLALSRLVPARLTGYGERVIYERIPLFRAKLADEVEDLVTRSLQETASGAIAAYYTRSLRNYFAHPQNFWLHLTGSQRGVLRMTEELRSLERYLPPAGRDILGQIEDRALAKDNLDFQYAWQTLLKFWLFVHVPLTYGALLLAAAHIVLVYAFAFSSP
jgi:hypothetical protein